MEDKERLMDESCATQCHVDDIKDEPLLTPEQLEKCSKMLAESKYLAEEAKKNFDRKSARAIAYIGPKKGLSDPTMNITTTTNGDCVSNTWVSPNSTGGWSSGSSTGPGGFDPSIAPFIGGGIGSGGSSGGSGPMYPPLTSPHTIPNDIYRTPVPYHEEDWTDRVLSPKDIATEITRLKQLGYLKNEDLQPSKIFDELKSKFKSLEEFLNKSTREERQLFLDLVILKFREISLLENSEIQIVTSDKLKGRLALQITIDMTADEFFKEKENAEPLLPEEDKSVIEIEKDEISFK